jgi:hypothetical protein
MDRRLPYARAFGFFVSRGALRRASGSAGRSNSAGCRSSRDRVCLARCMRGQIETTPEAPIPVARGDSTLLFGSGTRLARYLDAGGLRGQRLGQTSTDANCSAQNFLIARPTLADRCAAQQPQYVVEQRV